MTLVVAIGAFDTRGIVLLGGEQGFGKKVARGLHFIFYPQTILFSYPNHLALENCIFE